MAEVKYVSRENLSYILGKIKATYVQQETGKGLSTNDFTTELLNKLNGIAAGAQVNVLEGIQVNGTDVTLVDKKANITVPTKVSELTNDSKYLTQVTEENLGAELLEKVNASAEGNHSHSNKTELDKIVDGDKAKWDSAAAKAHEHGNKAELDLIASGDKAKWDQATTDVNTVKADYLKAADKTELQTAINTEKGRVDTLVGEDSGKSARTIANEELAKQLIPETAQESLNELTEIAAWIQSHPGDAAAMNAAITALQNQVSGIDAGTGTVKKYVDDAIAALNIGDYAKAADLTALATRVSAIEADYVKASELVALTTTEIDEIWAAA